MRGEGKTRRVARRSFAASRVLTAGELAWIAAVPCALATLAAIIVAGPIIGRTFMAPGPEVFLEGVLALPEPVEHGRFVVAVLAPALLAVALVGLVRRAPRARPATIRVLTAIGQVSAIGFVVVCTLAQYEVIGGAVRMPTSGPAHFFTLRTWAVAVALPLLGLLLLRRPGVAPAVARWLRETPTWRIVCLLVAIAFTVSWLSTGINFDSTVGNADGTNVTVWDVNEAYAILDGRTPLLTFHSQYSQLWPYLAALVMAVAGVSLGTWTIAMTSVSTLALLGVYATFRRVVRNSLLALVLYLPFLATGFFLMGALHAHPGLSTVYNLWPLRYGGPYLLLWLTARHLDGVAPRRAWLLFAAGGLVAINNIEFGMGALVATLAALCCAGSLRSRRAAARLLGDTVLGLAVAVVLVSILTLAHGGGLPHLGYALEFPRLYGADGWVLEPMPSIGMHLVVYLTFAGAIVVAVVRALRGDEERLLTSVLAWAGTFGLLAGSYYAGRSDPGSLLCLFSAWFLALTLLLVAVVRSLAARGWRRPQLAEIAVLLSFGLMVSSLPNMPLAWSAVPRLQKHAPTLFFKQPQILHFVDAQTTRGERVVVITPLSHRVAYDAGVENVSPYSNIESMPTVDQVKRAVDAARREHVHRIFIGVERIPTEVPGAEQQIVALFEEAGYVPVQQHAGIAELSNQPGS